MHAEGGIHDPGQSNLPDDDSLWCWQQHGEMFKYQKQLNFPG